MLKIRLLGKEVNIHSITDVITNSSSTVFMFPDSDSVSRIRDIIKNLMEAMNVPGEPEDYFTIELRIDETYRLMDKLEDVEEDLSNFWAENMPSEYVMTEDFDENKEIIKNYVLNTDLEQLRQNSPGIYSELENYEIGGIDCATPYVAAKNDSGKNLVEGILNIFRSEAFFC